jgi:Flp pilus assembly protein TadG
MSCSRPSASRRARQGAAAVEFALLLPFLCFIFLATVDFCRVFYYSVTVSNCARNGALMGSLFAGTPTEFPPNTTVQTVARDAAKKDASNLTDQLIVDGHLTGGTVTVTVTYPFTTITQFPGIPRQTDISRTVHMSILPPTPRFN